MEWYWNLVSGNWQKQKELKIIFKKKGKNDLAVFEQ